MPYKDKEVAAKYMRDYQRKWIQKRRLDFFTGKECIDCGSTTNLELDHRNPTEKISSSIWSWSETKRQVELDKCDVRCFTCHRGRHNLARQKHGISRYRAGCRCIICRAAKLEISRRTTQKRRAENSNPNP